MKFIPVLCGASFKNKGVQALLDAVIDYLPSPKDVPPMQGHLPTHDETFEIREVDRRSAVRGARVQDRDRSVRRPSDVLPRVFGRAEVRLVRLQLEQGQARARGAPAPDAREQARGNRRSARRRHRRGDRPEGHAHGRHAVRRRQADRARAHEVPEPRHRRRRRAEDEGRPGQARHRAEQAGRGRSDVPRVLRSGERARRSSREWASCTSRFSSTA